MDALITATQGQRVLLGNDAYGGTFRLISAVHAEMGVSWTAFDLTDRGVKGRNPSGPIDAYVYTERGVYRPGENVNLTALVRDAAGKASNLPITMAATFNTPTASS